MRILSIESSCDETSAAVVELVNNKIVVHSNVTATSLAMHAKTGGIIPENAAREQVKYIIPVIKEALEKYYQVTNLLTNQLTLHDIDAIAVTYGPGFIGSLLVGVETAKTLSFVFNKPLIPVNHLLAHLFANFISPELNAKRYQLNASSFPFIGLIVSGGHTDLLYFESVNKYEWLGGTKDDAAGEALDKIGRLLGLSYPAGPEIEERAKLFSSSLSSKERAGVRFHSPVIGSDDFDFSFSGLKSEVMRFVQANLTVNREPITKNSLINEICFAVQRAVIDVLVKKTLAAAEKYGVPTILLGGGVSANQTLMEQLRSNVKGHMSHVNIFSPEQKYCTDNAAMIGAYALLNPKEKPWEKVFATPDLYFS